MIMKNILIKDVESKPINRNAINQPSWYINSRSQPPIQFRLRRASSKIDQLLKASIHSKSINHGRSLSFHQHQVLLCQRKQCVFATSSVPHRLNSPFSNSYISSPRPQRRSKDKRHLGNMGVPCGLCEAIDGCRSRLYLSIFSLKGRPEVCWSMETNRYF